MAVMVPHTDLVVSAYPYLQNVIFGSGETIKQNFENTKLCLQFIKTCFQNKRFLFFALKRKHNLLLQYRFSFMGSSGTKIEQV